MKLLTCLFLAALNCMSFGEVITTYTFDHMEATLSGDAISSDVNSSAQFVSYSAGVGAFPEGGPGVSVSHHGSVAVRAVFNVTVTLTNGSPAPSHTYFDYRVGNVNTARVSASSSSTSASATSTSLVLTAHAAVSSHNTVLDAQALTYGTSLNESCTLSSTANPNVYTGQMSLDLGTLSLTLDAFAPANTYMEAEAEGYSYATFDIQGFTSY